MFMQITPNLFQTMHLLVDLVLDFSSLFLSIQSES